MGRARRINLPCEERISRGGKSDKRERPGQFRREAGDELAYLAVAIVMMIGHIVLTMRRLTVMRLNRDRVQRRPGQLHAQQQTHRRREQRTLTRRTDFCSTCRK